MYCILITGIPATGKSTLAKYLSEELQIPMISKDQIKELLFDEVGFESRNEKVKLGVASMEIMYYVASQSMRCHQPIILENNFESVSEEGIQTLLKEYGYKAITIRLTGDYRTLYERFLLRNCSSDRHPGHVVNDYYPREVKEEDHTAITYEQYLEMVTKRGMDTFSVEGPYLILDTTDFNAIDKVQVIQQVRKMISDL